jgi:4-hydroxy-tetrahydrodipicolinate reductase
MKKINICVAGAGGRVGKEIFRLISESDQFSPYLAINTSPVYGYTSYANSFSTAHIKGTDVIIDFSSPTLLDHALDCAISSKLPLVSGTTGLSQDQKEKLKKAGKEIAILWAPNMSLGVAVLKKAIEVFSCLRGSGFDFQIEEFHHNKKKDNPSGTALSLQEKLIEVVSQKVEEPVGFRGGGILGIHKVFAMSDEEVITLEHNALNRAVFAKGALKAASWIVNQKSGIYSIEEVLFHNGFSGV